MDLSTVGFVVILVLYASVGVFATVGSAVVSRKLFGPMPRGVWSRPRFSGSR